MVNRGTNASPCGSLSLSMMMVVGGYNDDVVGDDDSGGIG